MTTTQTLTVHSRDNCHQLQNWSSNNWASAQLGPGTWEVKIASGDFSFGGGFAPEPFVILNLYPGEFKNEATGVWTKATFVTLNGLNDVLKIEVKETTGLAAGFLDPQPSDNLGEITLEITKR